MVMEIVVMVGMAGVIEGLSGRPMENERRLRSKAVHVAVMLAVLCAGCSFSGDKKEAEQLADQYFAKIQGEDLEGALSLYSARFYEATSRSDWLGVLESQRARCGTPKTHTLIAWNVFSSFGTNGGVRTTLTYDVQYSNCRMSEKMITFKPDDGIIQIQGHWLKKEPRKQDDKGESQVTLKT
jgi:hypothetical protein